VCLDRVNAADSQNRELSKAERRKPMGGGEGDTQTSAINTINRLCNSYGSATERERVKKEKKCDVRLLLLGVFSGGGDSGRGRGVRGEK